jgi:hypothetical protein
LSGRELKKQILLKKTINDIESLFWVVVANWSVPKPLIMRNTLNNKLEGELIDIGNNRKPIKQVTHGQNTSVRFTIRSRYMSHLGLVILHNDSIDIWQWSYALFALPCLSLKICFDEAHCSLTSDSICIITEFYFLMLVGATELVFYNLFDGSKRSLSIKNGLTTITADGSMVFLIYPLNLHYIIIPDPHNEDSHPFYQSIFEISPPIERPNVLQCYCTTNRILLLSKEETKINDIIRDNIPLIRYSVFIIDLQNNLVLSANSCLSSLSLLRRNNSNVGSDHQFFVGSYGSNITVIDVAEKCSSRFFRLNSIAHFSHFSLHNDSFIGIFKSSYGEALIFIYNLKKQKVERSFSMNRSFPVSPNLKLFINDNFIVYQNFYTLCFRILELPLTIQSENPPSHQSDEFDNLFED